MILFPPFFYMYKYWLHDKDLTAFIEDQVTVSFLNAPELYSVFLSV